MTRYDALSRTLEIVLTLKRVTSDQLRNQIPAPGAGQDYRIWEDLAETIREMMRDARFGDGKSKKCAEQSETEDNVPKQIADLIVLCDEAEDRARKLLGVIETNMGQYTQDARDDISQVVGFMEDARHDLLDAADQCR